MRRFFLFAVLLCAAFSMAEAQPSIKFDNPEISFRFKRCICSGNTAYVDFLIMNNSSGELSSRIMDEEPCDANGYTAAYDDEGNVYRADGGKLAVRIADSDPFYRVDYSFNLPMGVPVKMRVTLTGVDEFATMLPLLKIAFRGMETVRAYGIAYLEVRDIPIVRQ